MPASKFNTYLRGFLGVLDAKVQGKAPEQFDDTVRVTIDGMPFVFSQQRKTLTGDTAAITLPGWWDCPELVCPADEVWLVRQCGWVQSAVLTASENFMASVNLHVREGVLGIFSDCPLPGDRYLFVNLDHPGGSVQGHFIMTPGDQLGIFAHRCVTADNVGAANVTIQYSPCKV